MKLVHVAVGVIVNADGRILIAKRPQAAHQGGLWEFPGGKVDAGETVEQALLRELSEELAINVEASQPLIQIRHHYPDKSVLLDVHKVVRFSGEPIGNEGQPVQWVAAQDLTDFEFPAANKPIISAINLPEKYLITGQFYGQSDFVSRLKQSLSQGVQFVQLRIENFSHDSHLSFLQLAISMAESAGARLTVNCSVDDFLRIQTACPHCNIGLHLNRHQASGLSERPIDDNVLLGVSCHNAEEILHAQKLSADYLLLSPVLPTSSHPDVQPLGWDQFSSLVELANIPVYALGGLGEEHISLAQSYGAQGIAGISAWW